MPPGDPPPGPVLPGEPLPLVTPTPDAEDPDPVVTTKRVSVFFAAELGAFVVRAAFVTRGFLATLWAFFPESLSPLLNGLTVENEFRAGVSFDPTIAPRLLFFAPAVLVFDSSDSVLPRLLFVDCA